MPKLLLHSRLYTWLQWIGQGQLKDETRNIYVLWGFGVIYIRGLAIIEMYYDIYFQHDPLWNGFQNFDNHTSDTQFSGLHISIPCNTCWRLCRVDFSWWRHEMETSSALLAICAGNSPVSGEFPAQSQWRGALMFSLICIWINGWVNNSEAGDLRRYRAHYDVIVMCRTDTSVARLLHSSSQDLYPLSGKTSYRQISWSLEAARLGVIIIAPLWNLTGTSAALLPRSLSNFRAIEKV